MKKDVHFLSLCTWGYTWFLWDKETSPALDTDTLLVHKLSWKKDDDDATALSDYIADVDALLLKRHPTWKQWKRLNNNNKHTSTQNILKTYPTITT